MKVAEQFHLKEHLIQKCLLESLKVKIHILLFFFFFFFAQAISLSTTLGSRLKKKTHKYVILDNGN